MANPEPQEGKDKEIIFSPGELLVRDNPLIEEILLDDLRKQGHELGPGRFSVGEGAKTWREGTRSFTKVYALPNYKKRDSGDSGAPDLRYVAKLVMDEHIEDAIIELSVRKGLSAKEDTQSIFPRFIDHIRGDGYFILISERPDLMGLDELFKSKRIILPSDFNTPIGPIIQLNERVTREQRDDIDKRIVDTYKESGIDPSTSDGMRKIIVGIERPDAKYYARNWTSYSIQGKKVSKDLREEIRGRGFELAREFQVLNQHRCFMIHDLYPSNHLIKHIIDAGDIKLASRAMQLGCLVGEADVWYKLSTSRERESTPEEREEVILKICKRYSNGVNETRERKANPENVNRIKIGPERLKECSLVNAAYCNLRLTYDRNPKNPYLKNESDRVIRRRAALEQLTLAGKKSQDSLAFVEAYKHLGWEI